MKKNLELLIGLLIGIAISITGTALAETLVNSEDVPYSNEVSSGTYDDVQDAIDELYKRANYLGYEYQEEILNGAYPVLGKDMIPIYLSDNGDAYYADLYTKWYSYKEKKWANAVMLTDTGKTKDYKTGDKIEQSDIRAYFVWIPRYAYKIWDLGNYTGAVAGSTLNDSSYEKSPSQASNNARIIDVVFGTKDYFNNAGSSLNTKSLTWNDGQFTEPTINVGDYLQHPGFTFGTDELNGIWVGKFENSKDNTGIFVKPNETSWTNQNVNTFFQMSLEFNATLTSHMMKNTEWGAAAYLSHSQYGKGAEVNINNASDYKTGYSASPNTDQSSYKGTPGLSTEKVNPKTQPWNTAVGYLASTTGNITGIYDMAGGAWEYVAAAISNQSDDESGMKEDIELYAKQGYIDLYNSDSTWNSYSKRILGDATGEMGPFYSYKDKDGTQRNHNSWYADSSTFVGPTYPWFLRGGHLGDGVLTGQFVFGWNTGAAIIGNGCRLVLTGTNLAS